MQNNVMIFPMTAEHVPGVAALEEACFSDPWPLSAIESELKNELSYWLVALDGNEVVGYVGSQSVLGEADIMNVAVRADHRRMGIAAALLERLREDLHKFQVHSLTLEVRASNDPAIALYERLGYVQVGRRPGYYHHPKEDALILRKEWKV